MEGWERSLLSGSDIRVSKIGKEEMVFSNNIAQEINKG